VFEVGVWLVPVFCETADAVDPIVGVASGVESTVAVVAGDVFWVGLGSGLGLGAGVGVFTGAL